MNKSKQLESEIHYRISELINELDNEIASEATVTEVMLNGDNSIVKVYVSFINDEEASFFELKKATSYIRRELARSLTIKKVPFIEFILDNQLDRINQMEEMIKKVNK